MRWTLAALAIGCTRGEPSRPPPVGSPEPTETGTPTPTPPACAPSPTLTVTSATVADGRLPTEREIAVALSEPASVAALCTDDADPTEQHLVRSDDPATAHALRLQGLLPERTYTCEVAPTCPTMSSAEGGPSVRVPVVTEAGPNLPRLEVSVDPALGMTGAYTLLSYVDGGGCDERRPTWLVVYDADGLARWWLDLPEGVRFHVEALFHASDRTIVWGGGGSRDGGAHVVDLWSGADRVLPAEGSPRSHHDGKRLPDGAFLTLLDRATTDGSAAWQGFVARVTEPDGAVRVEIDSQRYFDDGALPSGVYDDDPYHANWVEHVAEPAGPGSADRLYVSLCRDWSVLALDAATGDVRWKLADGLGWVVEGPSGPLDAAEALPQCQHGLEVLGDDHLLVYDNGRGRQASRISELRVDPEVGRVELLWEWTEPGWYENSLGDVDDLGNGRILVTRGHAECWSTSSGDRSAVIEVDRATGAVASRLELPDPEHLVYRAERYDGCALFSSLRACPASREAALALAETLGWTVAP